MKRIYLDFETYYDTHHSLKKMSPIAYVMHPDTEIISVSVIVNDKAPRFIAGEKRIKKWAAETDFSDAIVIAHNNSGFDGLVCAWRLGIKPKMWGCTMSMARQWYAKRGGLSLANIAKRMGLPHKLSLEDTGMKGKHSWHLNKNEWIKLREYNNVDTFLCKRIFERLIKRTGARGLKVIDLTIRMLLEDQFELDKDLLQRTLDEHRAEKKQQLIDIAHAVVPEFNDLFAVGQTDEERKAAIAVSFSREEIAEKVREQLASAPKFKKFLERRGIEVPLKPSPSDPEKMIPALAKTDEAFTSLAEHEDPLVCAAVDARLSVRSTILETRIVNFLEVGDARDGKMPIALAFGGADTTGRWSGIMKLNHQNLPRVNPKEPKPTDALRKCLRAPDGWKVVVADLAGIEMRVNMTLWKVPYAMRLFNQNADADLYKPMASEVLGVPLEGMPKMVRQAGKAMHLGCGFGLGSPQKYIAVAKGMANVDVSEDEAVQHIRGYRNKHPEVVRGWKTCHKALEHIANGKYGIPIDPWGLCETAKDGIKTPTGFIYYPNLRRRRDEENDRMEWVYGEGKQKTARIYAGKVDENIVQHLAKEVLTDMILRIAKSPLGKLYPLKHTVHDELIYIVRDEDAQDMLDLVQDVMQAGVDWWPELVTFSEGDIAQTYGDAK